MFRVLMTEEEWSPSPFGDWGLQSSHRCGCGPTKGSESLIRDGGQGWGEAFTPPLGGQTGGQREV